jgi:hypothetical protein
MFLLTVAACLACEPAGCCQDSGHQDEWACRCVCAIAGLPGMAFAEPSQHAPDNFEMASQPVTVQSADPPSLFRPPRV